MFWEDLTASKFAQAIVDTEGVCILPIGAIEKHGPHLPLGTDLFVARRLAQLAADIEKAVIFPYFPYSQINEAQQQPGTVAMDMELLLTVLEATCREISRNGFKKIVILNGPGGNPAMLNYFCQAQLRSPRDYTVYIVNGMQAAMEDKEFAAKAEAYLNGKPAGAHAGGRETSMVMAICRHLVDMDSIYSQDASAQNRLPFLKDRAVGLYNSMFWYADYPNHYAGDPSEASVEAGEFLLDGVSKAIAKALRVVKDDHTTLPLMKEFFDAREH